MCGRREASGYVGKETKEQVEKKLNTTNTGRMILRIAEKAKSNSVSCISRESQVERTEKGKQYPAVNVDYLLGHLAGFCLIRFLS